MEEKLIFGHRKKLLEKSPRAFRCGRWDLNPHDRIDHKILSLARLPIPTLPRNIDYNSKEFFICQQKKTKKFKKNKINEKNIFLKKFKISVDILEEKV